MYVGYLAGSVVIDGDGLIQNRLQVQRREEALRWCCRSIVATVHGEFGGASKITRGGERLSRGGVLRCWSWSYAL